MIPVIARITLRYASGALGQWPSFILQIPGPLKSSDNLSGNRAGNRRKKDDCTPPYLSGFERAVINVGIKDFHYCEVLKE